MQGGSSVVVSRNPRPSWSSVRRVSKSSASRGASCRRRHLALRRPRWFSATARSRAVCIFFGASDFEILIEAGLMLG
eukprot:3844258-Pyramimonas_sp.AAC.1